MQVFNPYLPLDTYIPDGEPHVFGNRLYVFGSHDKEGGDGYCLLDYEAWSAPLDDLGSWHCEGTIYKATQDPIQDYNGKYRHLYAPDAVQGADGRYYLYYALAGSAFTGPIHVAVCDTPAGKYEYYGEVRNPDGSTFDRCITFDPGVLADGNDVWLYYGWALSAPNFRTMGKLGKAMMRKLLMPVLERKMFDKTKEQIMREPLGIQGANVVKLDKDMLTVLTEPKRIIPGVMDTAGTGFEGHGFFEASSIRKIGDIYYFIYSSEMYHELCYATSRYPDRDFTYRGVLVSSADLHRDDRLKKKQTEFTTNNHGSLVQVNGQWFIFYHRHTHNTQYSRQGCADRIELMPDGSFRQAEVTSCGLNGGPLKCEGSYPAPIACKIARGKFPLVVGNKTFPHVTHRNNERFITQIADGTRLEYKYFDFEGSYILNLRLRGSADGKLVIRIGERTAGEISVKPSDNWTVYTAPIAEKGMRLLGFDYQGSGKLEFLDFRFA